MPLCSLYGQVCKDQQTGDDLGENKVLEKWNILSGRCIIISLTLWYFPNSKYYKIKLISMLSYILWKLWELVCHFLVLKHKLTSASPPSCSPWIRDALPPQRWSSEKFHSWQPGYLFHCSLLLTIASFAWPALPQDCFSDLLCLCLGFWIFFPYGWLHVLFLLRTFFTKHSSILYFYMKCITWADSIQCPKKQDTTLSIIIEWRILLFWTNPSVTYTRSLWVLERAEIYVHTTHTHTHTILYFPWGTHSLGQKVCPMPHWSLPPDLCYGSTTEFCSGHYHCK